MSPSSSRISSRGRAIFITLALVMVWAPLYRSGKAPLALLGIEWLALCGLALVAWGGDASLHHLKRFERVLLGALVALPVVHLMPVPASMRLALPGQGDYYSALAAVNAQGMATLSLDAQLTLKALLTLLIPVAVYWMTRVLHANQIKQLVGLMLLVAGVQATIGLVQYGVAADPDSFWHFGLQPGNNARGTWTSRNNFAGFLNLALMIALALFMATLGRHRAAAGEQSLRDRLIYLSTWQGHRAFVYGFLALLILLAVIFTRSRMGILTSIVGVVVATMAYARRIGGENVYGLTGTIIASVMGAAVAIGLGPVFARFAQQDPLGDGRSLIFSGTFEGIGHFFPLGSGVGTYVEAFPRFQALEQSMYTINRAHNSYLEWLFTGGLPAALLIAAFLFFYVRQWLRMGSVWSEFRFIQTGAGIGCALTLMHDMADYNLFIPANLVYFAFLAGVFFHPHRDMPRAKQRGKKRSKVDEVRSRVILPEVPAGQLNPFDEPRPA